MRNILRNWQFRFIFHVVCLGELVIFYCPCKCADNPVLLFMWRLETIFLYWNWSMTVAMNKEIKRDIVLWAKKEAHFRLLQARCSRREKLELPRPQVGRELLFPSSVPSSTGWDSPSQGLLLHLWMRQRLPWFLQELTQLPASLAGRGEGAETRSIPFARLACIPSEPPPKIGVMSPSRGPRRGWNPPFPCQRRLPMCWKKVFQLVGAGTWHRPGVPVENAA